MITVKILDDLPLEEMQPLVEESRREEFTFVDRLIADYEDGTNRFSEAGEAFYGVYADQILVAVGGLNRDPYVLDGRTGRVRHVYVLSAWRQQGIGRVLMEQIIQEASAHYELLTLRTLTADADQFYRALGFQTDQPPDQASHYLSLPRGK